MGGVSGSQNSSASETYGYNLAESVGRNRGRTGSESAQDVYAPQAGPLGELYGGVSTALGQAGDFARSAGNVAQPLRAAGSEFLGNLGQLGDPSGQIAAQTASLQSGLGDLFSNEINPALRGGAIGAGGLGSSRAGLAQGAAAGQIGDAFTRGLGDIHARANQGALAANTAGIGSLGGLYDLGMARQNAAWAPLMQAGGILGGPSVLTQGSSFGRNRGFTRSSGRSENVGSSKSSGKGYGYSIAPIG